MAIDVLLTMLYLLVIGGCVWLFTRHRDRPSMQAILMVPVSFALYALTRRIVIFSGGDSSPLLDDRFLVFFWAWLVAWVGWSARITWRLQTGRTVIGPDGQRWGVLTGRVGGVPIAAAKPYHTVIRAQVRAAQMARQAADEAEAVTALTPHAETGD
jgi:hypothetical protein